MIDFLKKRVKRMDVWDVAFTKWSAIAFAFWFITIWPAAMDWVHSVNTWYFFVAWIILAARPVYRAYLK